VSITIGGDALGDLFFYYGLSLKEKNNGNIEAAADEFVNAFPHTFDEPERVKRDLVLDYISRV